MQRADFPRQPCPVFIPGQLWTFIWDDPNDRLLHVRGGCHRCGYDFDHHDTAQVEIYSAAGPFITIITITEQERSS